MGYRTEIPGEWSRPWLLLWSALLIGLLASIFVLSFGAWTLAATIGFGIPELFAIARPRDAFPPLTYILRHFLPKWLTFACIYGLVGAIGAHWFGAAHPIRWAGFMAIVGWLTAHFDTVYDR